jgi:hypothetical protein
MGSVRALALAMFVLAIGCAAAPPRASLASSKQARAPRCTTSDECVLAPRGCCGHCGQAASGDVVAVLASEPDTSARCEGVRCPGCHADPDPALVAYCASGTCRALDLHTSPLARCTHDSDCIVRPRGCCECDATDWVAVNARQATAYSRRVCQPGVACPECVGAPPPMPASCDAGHCVLGVHRPAQSIDDLLAPGS